MTLLESSLMTGVSLRRMPSSQPVVFGVSIVVVGMCRDAGGCGREIAIAYPEPEFFNLRETCWRW